MIPEFGHFSLILSLCIAVILAAVPMWGAKIDDRVWPSPQTSPSKRNTGTEGPFESPA